jgi:hypothetical protein
MLDPLSARGMPGGVGSERGESTEFNSLPFGIFLTLAAQFPARIGSLASLLDRNPTKDTISIDHQALPTYLISTQSVMIP